MSDDAVVGRQQPLAAVMQQTTHEFHLEGRHDVSILPAWTSLRVWFDGHCWCEADNRATYYNVVVATTRYIPPSMSKGHVESS